MNNLRTLLLIPFLFLPGPIAAQAPAPKSVKAVKFGRLWDAKGKVWNNAIVIVEGDPLSDIDIAINHVRWAMKGGAVVVDKTRSGE